MREKGDVDNNHQKSSDCWSVEKPHPRSANAKHRQKTIPANGSKLEIDFSLFEMMIKSKEMQAIEQGIAMSKDTEHLRRPPRLDRKTLALSFRQISISTYSPTVRRKLL